jgi:hypothetical protein
MHSGDGGGGMHAVASLPSLRLGAHSQPNGYLSGKLNCSKGGVCLFELWVIVSTWLQIRFTKNLELL